MTQIAIDDVLSRQARTWATRGYQVETATGARPVVAGDTGQFYCDAVANDAQAAVLMEHLRQANPDEYTRYREDAADDGIDLDASQDLFLHGHHAY